MAKSVKDYWEGDLEGVLKRQLAWLVSRMNVNVSPFFGNALRTPTSPALGEGAINRSNGSYNWIAQEDIPTISFYALAGVEVDQQRGPDGFLINQDIVNVLRTTGTYDVAGYAYGLVDGPAAYRVDLYDATDVFYYKTSATIGEIGDWKVTQLTWSGTLIAFLMPTSVPQPEPDYYTPSVLGWLGHTNMGVGRKLKNYWVRLYSKTDIEYVQEDNIPIVVQDSIHARFGSSVLMHTGTLVAHVLYNDPEQGPVDLYSTLQNQAVYSDLPRSIEVPANDPDYVDPTALTKQNVAAIQNRSWIYSAALVIFVFVQAGLWQFARRTIARLNRLREAPGFLPSLVLENAEDGATSRWELESGMATVSNEQDDSKPPYGSRVLVFSAGAAVWKYIGAGLPDTADRLISWHFKTSADFTFWVGVTSSTGQVEQVHFVSTSAAGYDPGTKTITVPIPWDLDAWRAWTEDLKVRIGRSVPGEDLVSIDSFRIQTSGLSELRFDDLAVGEPQPEGSLSFSYDVYNGHVDHAYIRSGSIAWVAYAYGTYMEQTQDFYSTALGLESLLKLLFSLQYTGSGLRHNLITLGWGRYQDPGYQYIPGQIFSVSTEHNLDCYWAFSQAAKVLPPAAESLRKAELITAEQYNSLRQTAADAATKAGEVKTAILTQLWIPPAGDIPGHFAQGIHGDTGELDTALALDASGSWAALFCHNVKDDTKAVQCLKFIFANFWLANKQILKSTVPAEYNQAYEQPMSFDGFQTYADSEGGYDGSPLSIWMEGTWGALAGYLRLADNASLRSYFNAHYAGGLDAFLRRAIYSMQIVSSTTGDSGLLDFQLAARFLPWEFSVRKTVASTAWFWLVASLKEGVMPVSFESKRLLKVPQGVEQRIDQLEGRGSIGALELEAIDGAGFMTALVSEGKLEGKKVALRVGYPGLNTVDFVTVATQQIEAVQVLGDCTGFRLECRDLKRSGKSKVFLKGDDGAVISKDHPRTLSANPIDIVLMIFQNELGVGQIPGSLPEDWLIYDPSQWVGGSNGTLIVPNPCLDLDQFLFCRNGIFAGYLLEFTFEQPVEAKQFLELEIFKTLGGWMLVLADGRVSCRFNVPPYSLASLFEFDSGVILGLPGVERQPIINQVTYRMDYDGGKFLRDLLFVYAPSVQQFNLAGQHIIESKGLRANRGAVSLAGLGATRIFRRFGGIDPVSGLPSGGTPVYTVTSQYMTLTVEVGDYVYLSHPLLPDFTTGLRGVASRLCEVIEKQPNFSEGTMTYKLLDIGWIAQKKLSAVAPDGTPAWPAASQAERDTYMFACDDATGEYSDGTPGKTIW